MITIKELPNLSFSSIADMFKALRENKALLIAQKKMATKFSDPVSFRPVILNDKGIAVKAETFDPASINKIQSELVINTTLLMDSHSDVHLNGMWNKSVKEKKELYLLQEHQMKFDKVISDNVKAMVRSVTWKELGANYPGSTEALIFDTEIDKLRNPLMFEQYAKGWVKNHSVGMRYVSMAFAMNSESKWDVEEKENWDKYIDLIANKEDAEAQGYFWAITEAKIIEGSAVLVGSNSITPVLSSQRKEAVLDTSKKEPPKDTPPVDDFYKNLL